MHDAHGALAHFLASSAGFSSTVSSWQKGRCDRWSGEDAGFYVDISDGVSPPHNPLGPRR